MNINVNGINVSVKQDSNGAWYATYTTPFAPDNDVHQVVANVIGAVTWQHQCIGASAPWSMNADGDATWVMDFDITPDAVRIDVWDCGIRGLLLLARDERGYERPVYLDDSDALVADGAVYAAAVEAVERAGGSLTMSGWYPASAELMAAIEQARTYDL